MRLKFRVGLSNGETVTEGDHKEGELSPWIQLMDYLVKTNTDITSLSIVDGVRTFNLPSSGRNPRFRAFLEAPKPKAYRFFRQIGGFVSSGETDLFAVAEAVYDNYSLQLWVDENQPENSWVLVK